MKQSKWEHRDKERNKRKNGMRISGASCKLIQEIQRKRADELKKEGAK
jgi:hypothetical protein